MSRVTEQQREEALRTLRMDYWDDVRAIVEDLKAEIAKGRVDDADKAYEWIDQTVEGHARCIYNHLAIETLLFASRAEEEAEDACALEGKADAYELYRCLAFYGLRADVLDTVGNVSALFEADGSGEEV